MKLQQLIEQPRVWISVVAGVVSVLALGFVVARLIYPPSPTELREYQPQAYFFDQNTGELFTATADLLGPIETASGPFRGMPAGVRANVYACGSCDDESRRFIGWLEIPVAALIEYDPQQYGRYANRDETEGEIASTMIRLPDDDVWVLIDSPPAQSIFARLNEQCGLNVEVYRCRPPRRRVR